MHPGLLFGLLLFWLAPPALGITTPSSGAVLRGPVTITGDNQVLTGTFSYSELSFSYIGDPTGTWFLIATAAEPISGGTLATWDTAAITDGDYALRLRVYLQDGTTVDVTVSDLHVRNDTAIPTATPPVAAEDLPTQDLATATRTPAPALVSAGVSTPVPLPDNPASLTDGLVLATMWRGAFFALIAFGLIALTVRLRASR